ncbi:restriction endonuclease subunit S [Campylobacter gastrosuis]|uniref:Restriction endonuclease subunit S n=1 Tax=Campylobacter gastrosuis TaxID=2974576 RepID=A0ABT7HQE5_9BACT|nr:restriction endonuclease subunit S [Campylobacter gastrosuis]MDL0089065.1 restriction endonuclease subunit S [Campylobacter gastrosuis]
MQIAQSLFDKLNVKWGNFKLIDLFEYERGSRLTKNNRQSGAYPLVTAGETNLGVKEFISNENQKIFNNAITIDMFCNSFVHIKDFCCDDNVLVLKSKNNISIYVMHFISAIINKDKFNFGYGKQYRQNTLEKHIILLPIDDFGNPNFTLMENFIKEIKQNHTQKLINYYRFLENRESRI